MQVYLNHYQQETSVIKFSIVATLKCAKYRQILIQGIKIPFAFNAVGLQTQRQLDDPFSTYNFTGVNLIVSVTLGFFQVDGFLPLHQNESSCKTIHMKICYPYCFFFMQIKLLVKEVKLIPT